MRVLVCGSRDWDDWKGTLHWARMFLNGDVLIHGAARGADTLAHKAVEAHGFAVKVLEFPADWKAHGKAAGPIRNQRMLDEAFPDVVIAFKDGLDPHLRKGGTEDMIRRAKAAGIPVYVVSHG